MERLLDRIEAQINDLVTHISKLESVEDQPTKFSRLDSELLTEFAHIEKQYQAQKRLEELHKQQQTLDTKINASLIELAECRKELENIPSVQEHVEPVDTKVLLDYASRIARFTRQMPGNSVPSNLPWPAEDQLRRGMLATVSLQTELGDEQTGGDATETTDANISGRNKGAQDKVGNQAEDKMEVDETSKQPRATGGRARKPLKKINLDFDSDED